MRPDQTRYSLRYVVLHHVGVDRPHYDLFYEASRDEPLSAFRLSEWPATATTRIEAAAQHRREYLTAEGDISGGRGSVRRVAEGMCTVAEDDRRILLTTEAGVLIEYQKVPS